MHESNAIIDSVQLIPLGPSELSPMIEKVKIKVFYLGANRNGSYIDKPTALNMAKTLRGCPIVGRFRKEKQDFTDHGDEITINDEGMSFECKTRPYGFVDLNAEIWFEDYVDLDEFGNSVQRTYLVTQGIVWAGQYPEVKAVLQNAGRPQSMELDEKTLEGHWSEDYKSNTEIFIINDAIFSKLCILGEDTEPCFEGASVTSAEVGSNFALEADGFKTILMEMVKEFKELTFSLKEGGKNSMSTVTEDFQAEENLIETEAPVAEESASSEIEVPATENFENSQDNNDSETLAENQNSVEEFEKKEDKEEGSNEEADKESAETEEKEEDEDKKEKPVKNELEEKYSLLEQQYSELNEKYSSLKEERDELFSFKQKVEDKQKDELIAQFFMLSEEDKKDVIENKSKYSLDEIEKELSVICVRKKVSFEKDSATEQDPAVTYNLNETEASALPQWLQAVEDQKNRNN